MNASTRKRIRIRLKASDFDSLVQTFKPNLMSNGVFIKTSRALEEGTSVLVELLYADGESALRGEGVVDWVRAVDSLSGMTISLEWDRESAELVRRVLATPTIAPPEGQTEVPNASVDIPSAETLDVPSPAEEALLPEGSRESMDPPPLPARADTADPGNVPAEDARPDDATAEAPDASGAPPVEAQDGLAASELAASELATSEAGTEGGEDADGDDKKSGVWGWLKKTFGSSEAENK